jgi:heme/copper-type cytochrome/quinol oxidase subunit 2
MFSLGLPLWVVAILAFSVLLWSASFNNGALALDWKKRTGLKSVGRILLLFAAIFSTFLLWSLLLPMWASVIGLGAFGPNLTDAWTWGTGVMLITGLIMCVIFAGVILRATWNKSELGNMLMLLIAVDIFIVSCAGGAQIRAWQAAMPSLYLWQFWFLVLSPSIFLSLIATVAFVALTYPSRKEDRERFWHGGIAAAALLITIGAIVGSVLMGLVAPTVVPEPALIRSFLISASNSDDGHAGAYALEQVPVRFVRFGYWPISYVGIDYGSALRPAVESSENPQRLLLIEGTGAETEVARGYWTIRNLSANVTEGIEHVMDSGDNTLIVWYNPDTFKQHNVTQIALEGLHAVSLDNTQYQRSNSTDCSTNTCDVTIQIMSTLGAPVIEQNYKIGTLPIADPTRCTFANITIVGPNVTAEESVPKECSGSGCAVGNNSALWASFSLSQGVLTMSGSAVQPGANATIHLGLRC